jgi:hypothetical protein
MPSDVEFGKIVEMAAQLSGASAEFRGERRKERYAHRKKLHGATLDSCNSTDAKMLLLFIANDLNGFADCFHGCGDNSLRRVRFNVSKSPAPDFSQLLAIRESDPQDVC